MTLRCSYELLIFVCWVVYPDSECFQWLHFSVPIWCWQVFNLHHQLSLLVSVTVPAESNALLIICFVQRNECSFRICKLSMNLESQNEPESFSWKKNLRALVNVLWIFFFLVFNFVPDTLNLTDRWPFANRYMIKESSILMCLLMVSILHLF